MTSSFVELKYRESRRVALERDNHRCRKCGSLDRETLTVHHLVPRSKGGLDSPENLITLCDTCHQEEHKRVSRDLQFLRFFAQEWVI
jgi:5-methylcytosine-specific restriction endonuclease McrA